jgi:hypothetical protein
LVDLVDDDRAILLGAFLGLADQLQDDKPEGSSRADLMLRWRRRGLRVFDADKNAKAPTGETEDGQPGWKPVR